MPYGPTCLKRLISTKHPLLPKSPSAWPALIFFAGCNLSTPGTYTYVSQGILRINLPEDVRITSADSVLKSADQSAEIVITHLSRMDTAHTSAVLGAEDLVASLQDSLAYEAGLPYVSRPLNRFSGVMRGTFFVAARDQEHASQQRTEVLVLESPHWFHVIQVRFLKPSRRLNRDILDEMYDSAAEIQTQPSRRPAE